MEHADVLIVGGGPAGSSCAWKLRQSGCQVILLDKKAFPRNKPCAGWITPQVLEALRIDLNDYRRGRVLQPIDGFRSGLIGGGEVLTRYPKPISYGIRRCEFDTYLLERAGIERIVVEPLKTMQWRGGRWIVNERFTAPVVVGAGGHFCPVARRLGARRNPAASTVVAQEIEFHAADFRGSVAKEAPELFFCPDLLGYGWCFRKGDFLNIGLGRLDSDQLSSQVREFCEFLRQREKVCCDIPARFAGHAYQLYERILPKLYDQGVVLVGDAAGLAYPKSGEGIRPAVESGLIAADVLIGAKGNAGDLACYEARVLERFGRPTSTSLLDRLPLSWIRFFAARLLTRQWFAKSVVMDQWFLHSHQPALATSFDGYEVTG